jgi:hypothetical protein
MNVMEKKETMVWVQGLTSNVQQRTVPSISTESTAATISTTNSRRSSLIANKTKDALLTVKEDKDLINNQYHSSIEAKNETKTRSSRRSSSTSTNLLSEKGPSKSYTAKSHALPSVEHLRAEFIERPLMQARIVAAATEAYSTTATRSSVSTRRATMPCQTIASITQLWSNTRSQTLASNNSTSSEKPLTVNDISLNTENSYSTISTMSSPSNQHSLLSSPGTHRRATWSTNNRT